MCLHLLFIIFLLDSSPARRKPSSSLSTKKPPLAKKAQNRHDSDSDQSPPRKKPLKEEGLDSDQSPPRKHSKTRRGSGSDQSPPRRRPHSGKDSDGDLSPPRRPGQSEVSKLCSKRSIQNLFCLKLLCLCNADFTVFFFQGPRMLSGGTAGLISVDVLRKEQEENRRRERKNQPLEGWTAFLF